MSLYDAYKSIVELGTLKDIPSGEGFKMVEHCPSCKQVVGTDNPNCKFNNTRLHGKS